MRNGTSATPSQKNGVVVRQVVGHGRLVEEHAYRQLAELYRALRLYVNCFQPRVLLVAKQVEGRTIHRTYDAAKTPREPLAVLRSAIRFQAAGAECWSVCTRPHPSLPAGGTIATGHFSLCGQRLCTRSTSTSAISAEV